MTAGSLIVMYGFPPPRKQRDATYHGDRVFFRRFLGFAGVCRILFPWPATSRDRHHINHDPPPIRKEGMLIPKKKCRISVPTARAAARTQNTVVATILAMRAAACWTRRQCGQKHRMLAIGSTMASKRDGQLQDVAHSLIRDSVLLQTEGNEKGRDAACLFPRGRAAVSSPVLFPCRPRGRE